MGYQQMLSEAFQIFFKPGNDHLAQWLFDIGYLDPQRFRYYCFSGILSEDFEVREMREKKYLVFPGRNLEVVFSTIPAPSTAELIPQLFAGGILQLPGPGVANRLRINSVDKQTDPVFEPVMTYRTLSPLFAMINDPKVNRIPRFLEPRDPDYAMVLETALRERLPRLVRHLVMPDPSQQEPDFGLEILTEPKPKLVAMKNSSGRFVRYAAWLFDFKLSGDPLLHQTAFYLGLGHLNHMGFGLLRPLRGTGIRPVVSAE